VTRRRPDRPFFLCFKDTGLPIAFNGAGFDTEWPTTYNGAGLNTGGLTAVNGGGTYGG